MNYKEKYTLWMTLVTVSYSKQSLFISFISFHFTDKEAVEAKNEVTFLEALWLVNRRILDLDLNE